MSNAAQYLKYFEPAVVGQTFAKGKASDDSTVNDAIVLKQCIFVSDNGQDSNSGNTPEYAVKTMQKAFEKAAKGKAVIYVCGPVTVSSSETWTCDVPVEIRRYTGFAIGGVHAFPAYKGEMFTVKKGVSLTVGANILTVAGCRTEEENVTPEGSIFGVKQGGNLIFAGDTTVNGNRMKKGSGGAIHNEGTVTVSGKLAITNVAASQGSAVYQAGTMILKSGSEFSSDGEIYLTKTAADPRISSALTVENGAILPEGGSSALKLDMADPYDGRTYVRYTSTADAETERKRYSLPGRITSAYVLTDDTVKGALELKLGQKNVVYVDPKFTTNTGTPTDKVQGLYADYPFTSLRDAYAYLKGNGTTNTNKGGLIYLVNPIEVKESMTVGFSTYADATGPMITIDGGISVKRYSQPDANHNVESLFNHVSNTQELFVVEAGGKPDP